MFKIYVDHHEPIQDVEYLQSPLNYFVTKFSTISIYHCQVRLEIVFPVSRTFLTRLTWSQLSEIDSTWVIFDLKSTWDSKGILVLPEIVKIMWNWWFTFIVLFTDLGRLICNFHTANNTKCGNFRIFLPIRF